MLIILTYSDRFSLEQNGTYMIFGDMLICSETYVYQSFGGFLYLCVSHFVPILFWMDFMGDNKRTFDPLFDPLQDDLTL